MNAIDYFDQGWSICPQAPCLIDGFTGASLSYDEVRTETVRTSKAMHKHGATPGTHVAVLAYNTPVGFTTVLSVLRAGCVWLPLNPRNAVQDNSTILSRLNCEVLFFERSFADLVPALLQKNDGVRICVCIDGQTGETVSGAMSLVDWVSTEGGEKQQSDPYVLSPDPERIFAIQSTGGTTGLPKGVVMPNRVLDFIVRTFTKVAPSKGNPVFLAAAPLTHAAGMVLQYLLSQGGSAVLFAKIEKKALLDAIPHFGITHTFLPPTVIYELIAQPDVRQRDYSSLQYFFYGASPMAPEKLIEALEIFGPVMAQIYGQTECGVPLTYLSPDDHMNLARPATREKLSSAGRVTPFTQVGIMAKDGKLLPNNETGEIVIKCDGIMSGYYQDEKATTEVRRNGWHCTGDIGRFDDEGFLHIVDRSRDMIISGGFNIYSAEVERAIMTCTEIQDCAVIGIPDNKWGESVLAVVVLRPNAVISQDELIKHCKDLVGSMKSPKQVKFVEALPRSSVGKILKREIKQQYWGERDRLVS